MSTGKTLGKSDVSFHRNTGNNDPGFSIKGHKLHWNHGNIDARRAGRIWTVLKMSQFSKEIQDQIKESIPNLIDGDTIRRREMVLHYAPMDAVMERRREIKENQAANEAIFRGNNKNVGNGIKTVETESQSGISRAEKGADDFK